jgi:hypothetical protein
MQVSEILRLLPESLEWMVLFNLSAIRELTDEHTIKAMYHLPMETDLAPYSHVVLSSGGRFLALKDELKLVEAVSGKQLSGYRTPCSLFNRFSHRLALVRVDEADSLGLGEQSPYSPVLLHIKIEEGYGKAQAIFDCEPSFEHYELLRAVGVKFVGGETKEGYYLAHFQNRLPIHIHAGILSHFSRTAHCNVFFLQHGNIDSSLENGLLQASQVRVNWSKQQCWQALAKIATSACQQSLSMTCQPPAPEKPFPYGDLVPLGFVLKALNDAVIQGEANPEVLTAQQQLRAFLLSRQEDKLWAFHTQRLVTATDSSLVLLGLNEPDSVEALLRFADGKGGYYPQLWSESTEPGKMLIDSSCRHWCQADYATTCLVNWLRTQAGLESKTPIEYLAARFEERSGLYFANPYLVDWVLAEAIRKDETAAPLRERLLKEVIASLNEDFSFGQYDVAFSTALGILTLKALGVSDRTIRILQLRLLELIADSPCIAIPFYSTLSLDEELSSQEKIALQFNETWTRRKDGQKQIRTIEGQLHSISLYLDTYQMITTAVFALALSQKSNLTQKEVVWLNRNDECHPRYQCRSHCEYIAKFALPAFLKL